MWKCFCAISILLFLAPKYATSVSVQNLQETYEAYLNLSMLIEKQDKIRISNWTEEFQINQVEVTTKYRLEMTKHHQHSFKKRPTNEQWTLCQRKLHSETTKLEQSYYVKENECLKRASSGDAKKKQAITQVGREIRKWRRSYKYLTNKCRVENPGDKENAEACLVNYMERDKYSHTFLRLLDLRSNLVNELKIEIRKSIVNLDDCLRDKFSKYLEGIRKIMNDLNKCYDGRGDKIENMS